MMTPVSHRIRDARKNAEYGSARAFAKANGFKESTYASHENGTRPLTMDAAKDYAGPLNTTWQWLMFGEEVAQGTGTDLPASKPIPRNNARSRPLLIIDEVDATALGEGSGGPLPDEQYRGRVVARWQIPAAVVRGQTSAPEEKIKIITVRGDSMVPDFLPGERVMVSLDDCVPSPPGVFAIWDGFGEVIKRAEMIPYSEPPTVRLISANKEYEARELLLDQVIINGRILGKWKWT